MAQSRPVGWLSLHGSYGMGKTGVMKSIVAACIKRSIKTRYVLASQLLSELRTSYQDNGFNEDVPNTESEIIKMYQRVQVLAIDEVDRVSDTDWSQSMLLNILNGRYDRRDTVATIIATNRAPGQLPPAFHYLASRMKDGEMVMIGGTDLRGGQIKDIKL